MILTKGKYGIEEYRRSVILNNLIQHQNINKKLFYKLFNMPFVYDWCMAKLLKYFRDDIIINKLLDDFWMLDDLWMYCARYMTESQRKRVLEIINPF